MVGAEAREDTLTLEFPGKGAFKLWNSKERSNFHMEFPEGGVPDWNLCCVPGSFSPRNFDAFYNIYLAI
jgi:hypothetical protein